MNATIPMPRIAETERVIVSPRPIRTLPLEDLLPTDEHTTEPNGNGTLKPRRFSPKAFLLAVLALLATAGIGRFAHQWWTVGRFIEKTDDAYVGGDITALAARVPGFIAEVAVVDNQQVRSGQLLVRLDDRDYRAALARAEATVSAREAALGNLDATRRLQEAVVNEAYAEITSAEAEISRAHDDQARYQKMAEGGIVSVQSFQKADTEYRQALAAGEKARASLTATQRRLEVIASQKLEAEAGLQQARAEQEIARLNLSYTEVRAPMDGVVGNRSARVGAFATPGAQLISIVPTRGLWIDANYKESQLGLVRPGSPAVVKLDSLRGRTFRGRVVSVSPATGAQFSVLPPENATGNFTRIVQRVAVRILLDDEASTLGQLRPGLSITAAVDGRPSSQASL